MRLPGHKVRNILRSEEMLLGCKSKLQVEYPCTWLYKIIGMDIDEINRAIAEVVGAAECCVSYSNTSKTGKYHSVNLEITVRDEAHRTLIYTELKNHSLIKMVL